MAAPHAHAVLASRNAREFEPLSPREMEDGPFETWLATILSGSHATMIEARRRIARYRHRRDPVLIYGERGTGKGVAAFAIHAGSERGGRQLIKASLAGLDDPKSAISKLYGHLEGAYTDAKYARAGMFQRAHLSSIFLDELQHAHREVQPTLLEAVDSGEVEPLGSDRLQKVDVRILAAANVGLRPMADEGRFLHDLIDRLGVLRLTMPPLRDHLSDLGLYTAPILRETGCALSPGAIDALAACPWPGNVRQLQSVLRFASALSPERTLGADLVRRCIAEDGETAASAPQHFTPEALAHALATMGSKAAVARHFGLTTQALRRKMEKLGLLR